MLAAQLCEAYIKRPGKTDSFLGKLPRSLLPSHRRRCQFLFLGVIRNLSRIDFVLSVFLKKQPRAGLKSILFVAAAELINSDEERAAGIINHAVECAKSVLSSAEAGLANAVLRKAAPLLKAPGPLLENYDYRARLAILYSHPKWLAQKWLQTYGQDVTVRLLKWNQIPPPIYVYFSGDCAADAFPELKPAKWDGVYEMAKGKGSDIGAMAKDSRIIVMDPASARPADLLDVRQGEKVLDLCAAPGGKSSILAGRLKSGVGILAALDRPGPRIIRLRENLSRFEKTHWEIVEADLLETRPQDLALKGLPDRFDAVLLDAPCSNTGVIRRRPDVRWRLQPADIGQAAEMQLKLLQRAAQFVSPQGRLVYSTCSLEEEENQAVVEKFIEMENGRWRLISGGAYNPWNDGHDGGGAYLLKPQGF